MLDIIFEDAHYVAINKPHGLLVHRTRIAEEKKEFALQMLRDQLGHKVYPIHRLDRGTSGVLLFAKTPEAAAPLVKLFEERETRKVYYAIVRGYILEEATIDNPIRPDKDHQHKEAQDAITNYKRIATVELPIPVGRYATARYSLVQVQPETGRMHQIRKHFAHIRHYIIGDKKHGDWRHNKMFLEELNSSSMLLHSSDLYFVHPFTNKQIHINAPLSANMSRLCCEFNWQELLVAHNAVLTQATDATPCEARA
ncbi:pseudouridylate synthase [Pontibacter sp. KCTC 32443]|uniref:pseudouridine synthase n=1 Tax=Pontibacter TaxID=323449 RepID=UPI00164EB284|nr:MULTISPECIES: pseudouridine synthase [Pontibacter]MBC5773376.1 pseudouridylate synthase [Pontibacter sp. KCTC 32443]